VPVMSLEVKNVSSGYGDSIILNDVSIKVEESGFITVLGANGAGKTTLLKTIFGFLKPKKGQIVFDGKNITGMSPNNVLRAGISYVPQDRQLNPEMTVYENLEMGAYIRRDKQKIREDMENVFKIFPRLKERQKQKAGFLSGGEQQMLALGRAFMLRPKLILIDEPSAGLAPIVTQKIFEVIKSINAQGIGVVLVEQNVKEALELANYGYVLDRGRIMLEGP